MISLTVKKENVKIRTWEKDEETHVFGILDSLQLAELISYEKTIDENGNAIFIVKR